jgi:hypothetical protein
LSVEQVPANETVTVSLDLLPVKSGSIALPSISLVFDKGINSSSTNTVFEIGQHQTHAQYIFVNPV